MTVNIDEITLGQLKEMMAAVQANTQVSNCGSNPYTSPNDYGFYQIGKSYFIRTVTHHHVGQLVGMDRGGKELILKGCSWVASDGRFTQAIAKGELDEVEPFPPQLPVCVNRETFIDAVEWTHDLPTNQK